MKKRIPIGTNHHITYHESTDMKYLIWDNLHRKQSLKEPKPQKEQHPSSKQWEFRQMWDTLYENKKRTYIILCLIETQNMGQQKLNQKYGKQASDQQHD